jgi:hypothetical protein
MPPLYDSASRGNAHKRPQNTERQTDETNRFGIAIH